MIYLTAPTTDDARLPTVLASASGFVYHVSIAGITGAASAKLDAVGQALARIRRHTDLPLAVGFGIKTAAQVAEIGTLADAAVVGSAIVQKLADSLDETGKPRDGAAASVLGFVKELAAGLTAA